MTPTPYLDRLAARSIAVGSVLCLGLDPDPATLPEGFAPDVRGVERFARLVLEAALPHVAAVKPNLAFYEAFGAAGLAALERIRAAIPPDVPVVIDAKRADIGTTARIAASSAGAVAPTTNPRRSAGAHPAAVRATRAYSGSAGHPRTSSETTVRSWTSPAAGFEVLQRA